MDFKSKIKTIEWIKDKNVSRMVDQLVIPYEYKLVDITTSDDMYNAIKTMIVRGAPAIGIAGAHGMALAALEIAQRTQDKDTFLKELKEKAEYLKSSRPTAVNLMWAVDKQFDFIKDSNKPVNEMVQMLIEHGIKLENEDIEINKKIGDFGAEHTIQVFADETRPRQQGARITTFELAIDGIPVTLITDGMSGYFMNKGMIDMVVVGADRIASNGDTANKIGTYNLAIVANYHNVPFYIAAPLSTIDTSIETGKEIPIEERSHEEVTHINGKAVCAEGINVINPGFDVTPASLIKGIITEKGVLYPPYNESIKKAFGL